MVYGAFLNCVEEYLNPPEIIILRGNHKTLTEWQDMASLVYHPRRMTFAIPDSVTTLPTLLAEKKPVGEIVAYHCEGMSCHAPITQLNEFKNLLA